MLKRWLSAAGWVVAMALLIGLQTGARAAEQQLFLNPFLSAKDILAMRGDTKPATATFSFRMTRKVFDEPEQSVDGLISIGPGWVAWSSNAVQYVYDFKLGREFQIDRANGKFSSYSLLMMPLFKSLERVNRAAMQAGEDAAGQDKPASRSCDADVELGILNPEARLRSKIDIQKKPGSITITCEGRVINGATLSDKELPPLFLAVAARELPLHPELLALIRKGAKLPSSFQSEYKLGTHPGSIRIGWTLVETKSETTNYPLETRFENVTEKELARDVRPGLATMASGVLAKTHAGGPPNQSAWLAKLDAIAKKDRQAAIMESGPALLMFPGLVKECKRKTASPFCKQLAASRGKVKDPAVQAYLTIITLDPRDPLYFQKVAKALLTAKASPLAQHPVLKAASAWAMTAATEADLKKLGEAGFTSSTVDLMQDAIEAYPYNTYYWIDLADFFISAAWNFPAGMTLLDTAMTMPMPTAQDSPMLRTKRESFKALMTAQPQFFP